MAIFHPTFVRRQLTATRNQSAIFVLCVALSMVTLVALRGFGDSVDRALTRDSRALIAGGVRLTSGYPFAPEGATAVQSVVQDGRLGDEAARTYEFYSVVRRTGEDASLLSKLKVVEPSYPLYGAVGPTLELLARGVKATLPGGERTYVCERQADAVAALLADFFTHCGT